MTSFTITPLYRYPQRQQVLALAREHAPLVDADRCSPFATLRELAATGNLLTLGRQGSLLPQAAVAFDLATECATTAFSLWAHRSVIAFFDAVNRELPEGLASGEVSGTTAMAAAFKEASGVGKLGVHARRVEGGLQLNGTVSWASNLYPGGVVVLPVRIDDAGTDGPDSAVVQTRVGADGFTVTYQKGLLALNATESGFSTFNSVFVPQEDILTTDLPGFLSRVTAPFLTLQSSFCLGLAAAALAGASEHLNTSGGVFTAEFGQLEDDYERLRSELVDLAEDPGEAERTRLLQLRLDVSHLATAATKLELSTVGGRAYSASSPAGRRLRESQFLPVQSPTEGHLRYELSKTRG